MIELIKEVLISLMIDTGVLICYIGNISATAPHNIPETIYEAIKETTSNNCRINPLRYAKNKNKALTKTTIML